MSTISGIDPAASLGELVAQRSARAPLFEELRLDYCCGGHQTLADACAKGGLERRREALLDESCPRLRLEVRSPSHPTEQPCPRSDRRALPRPSWLTTG